MSKHFDLINSYSVKLLRIKKLTEINSSKNIDAK